MGAPFLQFYAPLFFWLGGGLFALTGDIDVANPTAQNTVVVGSDINFTVSGTNTADVGCTLTLTFLRSA